MLGTAALNVSIERVAYKPLRNAPKLAPLISAIGMSFVLQNVGPAAGRPRQQEHRQHLRDLQPAVGVRRSTGITINIQQLFVAVVTVPLLIVLTWFVRADQAGQGDAGDRPGSRARPGLMGVNVDRTIAITFLIAGALAGAAGVVQILYNNTTVWNLGFRFGLNSFTAAVLGGIGNLQGAVLGAIVLGFINAFSDRYFSANWTNAIVFGVLIAILVFKPTGLLGQQLAERS